MSIPKTTRKWSAVSAADQAFLRSAYDRYKRRFLSLASPPTVDSFENWLSKRGIQKMNLR
jgi:hypothetical protein